MCVVVMAAIHGVGCGRVEVDDGVWGGAGGGRRGRDGVGVVDGVVVRVGY